MPRPSNCSWLAIDWNCLKYFCVVCVL
jgi:hypothetical protein